MTITHHITIAVSLVITIRNLSIVDSITAGLQNLFISIIIMTTGYTMLASSLSIT